MARARARARVAGKLAAQLPFAIERLAPHHEPADRHWIEHPRRVGQELADGHARSVAIVDEIPLERRVELHGSASSSAAMAVTIFATE